VGILHAPERTGLVVEAAFLSNNYIRLPAEADTVVPANTAETVQYVPGQPECGVIAPGQADAGELGCYKYTAVSLSSLLSVGGTPTEQAALSDLEQQAVSNTLGERDLPTSDGQTVLTLDRPDVEALEYVNWAGLDRSTDYNLLDTNAGSATLTSFLSRAPEPYGDSFTYPGRGQVLHVSLASGPKAGGTKVVVTGNWFQDVEHVRFGRHDARFQVLSQAELVAQAPPGVGTVAIVVTTPGGTSARSKPDLLTYRADPKK
jgi:IPT/TIG domain